MNKAVAYSNNDVALVSWQYDKRIDGCLGFAVYRTDQATNKTEVLPAWVGFRDESNKNWQPQTTEVWPVQKFTWRDLTAARGATYTYKVVPMIGSPGALKRASGQALTTNAVSLTPQHGICSAYFNRGILSTQSLAHQIPAGPSGIPNFKVLTSRIDQPGDPLRNSLAGQSIEALKQLLLRAKQNGGDCYCALYELNDPELLTELIGNKQVHIVLSNTGADDATNEAARQSLHESGTDVTDRMLATGHIGHNKFVVYVDQTGKPTAVLSGSTNWTYTGLCAQSNNAIIIESPELAKFYKDYWDELKEEGDAQSQAFRASNNQVQSVRNGDNIDLWFSPNTKQQSKPKNPATPCDLGEVFDLIDGAKEGILFLEFQPGSPSVIDQISKAQNANPRLFVRGAVTDPKAVNSYDTELHHRPGQTPDTVVAASAINDQFAFWQKELLKSAPQAHAIIHDKIVVIDPFTTDCVVVTGSHNQGFRASYNNDENLLIIRQNPGLAAAYAVHVSDVYDHYRWRYTLQQKKGKAWTGLSPRDTWQDFYFTPEIQSEVGFWV
jgi:phosphatidylserine/phosphatidylglycerophosphate/cardiolipin synthase-like enzyme